MLFTRSFKNISTLNIILFYFVSFISMNFVSLSDSGTQTMTYPKNKRKWTQENFFFYWYMIKNNSLTRNVTAKRIMKTENIDAYIPNKPLSKQNDHTPCQEISPALNRCRYQMIFFIHWKEKQNKTCNAIGTPNCLFPFPINQTLF